MTTTTTTTMTYPFDIQKAKECALNAALEAGNIIRQVLLVPTTTTTTTTDGGDSPSSPSDCKFKTKSTSTDLVTETDEKCDRVIIELLRRDFPDFDIISEETFNTVTELSDRPTWIIDPIDGTTNFVHRNPAVAVSIGLTFEKECVLGVIVLPMYHETYTAIKGQGAFKTDIHQNNNNNNNNTSTPFRISVSQNKTIDTSLLSSNFPYGRSDALLNPVFSRYNALLRRGVRGMRGSGSACVNLVQVACGALEGYFENGLQSWDMAAGKVIVEEAGGVVLDIDASPVDIMKRRILACNSMELATQISKVLVESDAQFFSNNSDDEKK